jgi:hypothetical protein
MRKGKILKIRMGHEANCSSGMVFLGMLFYSAVLHLPTGLITAGLQAGDVKKRGEIRKGIQLVPQIVGLLITAFLFYIGYDWGEFSYGVLGLFIGAAFAISVFAGNKLAHKIGYWNLLVVPLINIASAYVLFWLYIDLSLLWY